MKVLLDTNIIIHREASLLSKKDIGILFLWLDKLKYEKLIHPVTVQELAKLKNCQLHSYTEPISSASGPGNFKSED